MNDKDSVKEWSETYQIGFVEKKDMLSAIYPVLRFLDSSFVRQYQVFPLKFNCKENLLELAISCPDTICFQKEIEKILGCKVKMFFASKEDLSECIDNIYCPSII